MTSVYDFEAQTITGQAVKLDQYKGKVVLIVNTASKCGFTPQFEGLEALWKAYEAKGVVILGFPCNQFGAQEPGSEAEIQTFCEMNYKVTFPMFAKIDVNGAGTHPLFQYLKTNAKTVTGKEDITWNFTKFLIGKDGKVLMRYAPTVTPESLSADIGEVLKSGT